MSSDWRVLPLALGLTALPAVLRAQSAAPPPAPAEPSSEVRKGLTELLVADAHQLAQAAPAKAPTNAAGSPGAIMMDPYIVREDRTPVATLPHYETPLAQFLRTGEVARINLKKVSLEIAAPVEREDHGFAKPTIQFHLSW